MKSLTRSQIEKAVREKHGLSKDDIYLSKVGDYWWWEGNATHSAESTLTCIRTLDELSLERWIKDFEYRVLPFIKK